MPARRLAGDTTELLDDALDAWSITLVVTVASTQRDLARAALDALGVRRFVLAIHDVSFPSAAAEETGRGTPYGEGARAFLRFSHELGFDGVQLGPQGQTSASNPSPYDGSVFSKSLSSIALPPLAGEAWAGALPRATLDAIVSGAPAGDRRAAHAYAHAAAYRAVFEASASLRARAARGDEAAREVVGRVDAFAARAAWLAHDALFEALAIEHGTDDWSAWPAPDRALLAEPECVRAARVAEIEARRRDVLDAWAFGQYVLDEQHRALREAARALGLRLYGDLQVGLSLRDTWSRGDLFLPGYWLGAPPSRTNPEGQPWGYPVFDPRRYLPRFAGARPAGGPLALLEARMAKIFAELDGVRIDHPHGLVCPWVYDAAAADPLAAVAAGARLFGSPDRADHPRLAALAIARADQIDPSVPPYHDLRVRGLDAAQVEAYATLFDVILRCARQSGRETGDVLCEVLSTCPEPLRRVIERAGLGRFRVTQKANTSEPCDVYRSENAAPADWIMVGTHDTPPLQRVIDRWEREGIVADRAAYLAACLTPEAAASGARDRLARALASDRRKLTTAMVAQLFTSRAENVMVFWADLFGERAVYNTPGDLAADNWTLRVPRAFDAAYRAALTRGEAMDLPAALAAALRAKGAPAALALSARLDELSALPLDA